MVTFHHRSSISVCDVETVVMSLKPRRIDFDAVWQQLSDTVNVVICGGGVERPVWNDRFSDVYAVCVANPEPMADKLYAATKQFLEAHVRQLYRVTFCFAAAHDIYFVRLHSQWWSEATTRGSDRVLRHSALLLYGVSSPFDAAMSDWVSRDHKTCHFSDESQIKRPLPSI